MKKNKVEFQVNNTHTLLTQLQSVGNSDITVDELPEESIDDLLSLAVDIAKTGLSLDQYEELFTDCQAMYNDIDEAIEKGNIDEVGPILFKQ